MAVKAQIKDTGKARHARDKAWFYFILLSTAIRDIASIPGTAAARKKLLRVHDYLKHKVGGGKSVGKAGGRRTPEHLEGWQTRVEALWHSEVPKGTKVSRKRRLNLQRTIYARLERAGRNAPVEETVFRHLRRLNGQ